MNFIFSFLFAKQYRVYILLNIFLLGALVFYLNFIGDLTSRHFAYFFVAPFVLLIIFRVRNPLFKIAAPLFALIFIEGTIISSIKVTDFLRVGMTLIFALIALFSVLWYKERVKLPRYYPLIFTTFLTSAFVGIFIGNTTAYDLLESNISIFFQFYLEFLLFFYLGYQTFDTPDEARKLLVILMIFAGLSAVGHIFSMVTGKNLELIRGESAVSEETDLSEGRWRYGGFFGNVNTMSAFYVMLAPGMIYLLFNEKKIKIQLIIGISILAMVISLLMGASRGGLLFLILNTVFMLFYLNIDVKKISYGLIAVAVLVILANSLLEQYFTEYITRAFQEMERKGTESPRHILWLNTMEIVIRYPFGVGLSEYNFMTVLSRYTNDLWASPHNVYLNIVVQTGYIGLLSFVLIFAGTLAFVISKRRKIKDASVRDSLAIISLMITGFLLMGITEPIFRNGYKLNHIIGLALGMGVALSSRLLTENKILVIDDPSKEVIITEPSVQIKRNSDETII